MIYFILITLVITEIDIFSQCSGCNKNNQNLNIWNIDYSCENLLTNYSECNHLYKELNHIIDLSGTNENINKLGFQKWHDGELKLFALFDNRYKINDYSLINFKNINKLLFDGIKIIKSNKLDSLKLNADYVLLTRNNLSYPLSKFIFSDNMKYLSLDENNIIGEIPVELFNKTQLINLSIEFNEINGELPENLNKMKELKYFTINNNNLSGKIPDSICELKNLKVLHFQYNEFDLLPECLCEMIDKGVEIELYGNKFCENVPDCLDDSIGFQNCF